MIQKRLLTGGMIQRIVERQHILPGPVEVRDLPPAMGFGQPQFSRLLEIFRDHSFGYSNVLKCAVESVQKYLLQAVPLQPIQVKQSKGVPAGTVDRQQTRPAIQRDHMQIPTIP